MKLRFKLFQQQNWLIISSLALAMGLSWSQPIRAEGSVDLTENVVNRPFLDYREGANPAGANFSAGIRRRTTIQVYAEAGEVLNLGSSAHGVNDGIIRYISPDTTIDDTCNINGDEGLIENRAEELAGPVGGYNPCEVPVTQTGIWTIEFISPDPNCDAPNRPVNPNPNNGLNFPPQGNDDCFVSAWDVTVLNAPGGAPQPGRAYANYLPLNMGAEDILLNSTAYIQTKRGDLYRINLNNIDPFGFIFFANNKGFTENGEPSFQSVNADGVVPEFHSPELQDNGDEDITHKIFFNPPDLGRLQINNADVAIDEDGDGNFIPSSTFLIPAVLPQDPEVSTLTFTGVDGTPGNADPTRGGNFSFTTNEAGRYLITVDVNRDDILGNANDVVLRGRATVGTNTIFWNGYRFRPHHSRISC
ncbi:MAG: hypothetical protein F6J92_31965, partial [Symploca sp. SIO1A3]|nr:hypothetical protein [Symploca sp. SIO1A3]